MALTFSGFIAFAEVADWYNRTKPLGGAGNAGKDIRPIGDRSRKWERIVKVNEYCYALSDGYHYGDEHFPTWDRGSDHAPSLKDMAFYAPIVWRKHKDGTETVTFRNGTGPYQHNSRYAFLWRHTPRGLTFSNCNGKHFIRAGGKEYFLAKGTTVPRPIWDKVQRELNQHRTSNHNDPYRLRHLEWHRAKNDNASLTFTNVQGSWQWVSGGRKIPTAPKLRLDLDTKNNLKPHITMFRDWVLAIGPMLPIRAHEYKNTLRMELIEWAKETKTSLQNAWDLRNMLTKTLSQQIIADPEHPMRVQLAYVAITDGELLTPCEDQEDVKKRKAVFNRWVNRQLGLISEVKES